MLPDGGAQVACQVDGADDGAVDLAVLQLAHRGFQGAQTGALLAGHGETGTAAAEFTGHTAGDHAPQGAHGAVRRERRAALVTQLRDPLRELFAGEIQTQFTGPLLGLFRDGPAEGEVGAVQVERYADEDAGAQVVAAIEPRVLHGGCGRLQHQELLREHLLQLARRDAELVGPLGEFVEIEAGEGGLLQLFLDEPGALLGSPPLLGAARLRVGVAPQNPGLEGFEVLPRPETGVQADHGDSTPLFRGL